VLKFEPLHFCGGHSDGAHFIIRRAHRPLNFPDRTSAIIMEAKTHYDRHKPKTREPFFNYLLLTR